METYEHYVYILKCKDRTLYTGYTVNIKRRIKQHEQGKGAKYTRGRGPFKVVYLKKFNTQKEALRKEYQIKQLSRKEKLQLIERERRETDANSKKFFTKS